MYFYPDLSVREKFHEQIESRQEDERVIFYFNLQIFIFSEQRDKIVLFVVLIYFSPGFRVHKTNHEQIDSRGEDERVIFDFNIQIFIYSERRDSYLLFVLCRCDSYFKPYSCPQCALSTS